MRLWVARFRFPDKAECYFGTFQAETEMAAFQLAGEAWARIMPFRAPAFVLVPGYMTLHLDDA